jgi:periplasmic copper chaperone A
MFAVVAVSCVAFSTGASVCAQHSSPKTADPVAKGSAGLAKGIQVTGAWSRATPGTAKNGAVFLEIKSGPDVADKLLSVTGSVADNIEIHNHINDNGIMQMRRVDAVELSDSGSTKFVPGGYHVMLLGLKQPLKAGETFKLQLTFEKAGSIEADIVVRANSAAHGKGSGTH